MAVNGTEIAIGQKWLTRSGQEVEVVDNDGDKTYPWDLSNGASVTNNGQVWDHQEDEDDDDLITLIQDEHGFIPWNGGECPVGEGVKIEYKMKNTPTRVFEGFPDGLRWDHVDLGGDIIAYRVVKQEVKPAKVGAKEEEKPKQKKESAMETTNEAKEEPKYTVEQVYEAINAATDEFAPREIAAVKAYLAKTQDPDYKLYLNLKAKFE